MELLAQLGFGGLVGAALTLWSVQARWRASIETFRVSFIEYVEQNNNLETVALKKQFDECLTLTAGMFKAIDGLGRALRRRK